MSYCEVYAITAAGNVRLFGEARNSWGGAMYVWRTVGEEIGVLPRGDGDAQKMIRGSVLLGFGRGEQRIERIWNAVDHPDLPRWARIVLATTLDGAVVRQPHLPRVVDALERWIAHYQPPLPTLQQERDLVARIAAMRRYIGVCWNQTSVNASAWPPHRGKPYNLAANDDWFDVFECHPDLAATASPHPHPHPHPNAQ